MFFLVTKYNTAKENFSREKIENTYKKAAQDFLEICPFTEVKKN